MPEKIDIIATAKDYASAAIKTLRNNVTALGGKNFGPLGNMIGGFLGAQVASNIATSGFNALKETLQGVGEWLGKGAASAIEEQRQIASLGETLKANAKDWNGNTMAVAAALEARERLGFTDDQLRDSFSHLVVQTKSVSEALRQQAIAADLAHARNMDLTEASDLVNKAVLGNSRALRQLGIDATGAKTGVERLALIEKTFAGQTDAWLTTTAGKITLTNIKAGELQETVGGTLVPLFGEFAEGASNQLDLIATGFGNIQYQANQLMQFLQGTAPTADELWMQVLGGHAAQERADEMLFGGGSFGGTLGDAINKNLDDAFKHIDHNTPKQAAVELANVFTDNLADSLRGNKGFVKAALHDALWALNHPKALENQLARIKRVLEGPQLSSLLTSTNPMQRIIGNQIRDRLTAQQDSLTTTNYQSGVNSIVGAINSLKPYMSMNHYDPKNSSTGGGMYQVGYQFGTKDPLHYAKGGYIPPGAWGEVGENGREYVRAGRHGATVTPQQGHGHNIILNGRLVGKAMDEYLGQQLSMTPSGVFSRG